MVKLKHQAPFVDVNAVNYSKTDDTLFGGHTNRVSTVTFPIEEVNERGDITPVPPSTHASGLGNRTAVITRLGAPSYYDE